MGRSVSEVVFDIIFQIIPQILYIQNFTGVEYIQDFHFQTKIEIKIRHYKDTGPYFYVFTVELIGSYYS